MSRSTHGYALITTGSAMFIACLSAFFAKIADGPWEWYMIPISLCAVLGLFFMTFGLFHVRKSERDEILFMMDEEPLATLVGREDFYLLIIVNQSPSPIEVTHVWLELDDGKKIPVADSASHLPVVVPQNQTWKTRIVKLRAPYVKDWFLTGRARLLDGRTLHSIRCKPQPYVRVRTSTL